MVTAIRHGRDGSSGLKAALRHVSTERTVGASSIVQGQSRRSLDGEIVGVLVAVVVGDREGRPVDSIAKGRSPGDHEGGGCARRHRGRRLRGHHVVSRIGTANHHAGGAGEVEVVSGGGAEVFDRKGLGEASRTERQQAKEGAVFNAGNGVPIDNLKVIAEDLDFRRLGGRAKMRQEPRGQNGDGGEEGAERWHHCVKSGWKSE